VEKSWLQKELEAPFSREALANILDWLGLLFPPCFVTIEEGLRAFRREIIEERAEAGDPFAARRRKLWERLKIERPLLEAAKAGDIGAVRSAVANGARDLDGALWWAVAADQTLVAAYLLDAGKGSVTQPNIDHLLRHAIAEEKFETARFLCERGAQLPSPESIPRLWAPEEHLLTEL
jgi:hypothetical protein